MEMRFETSNFNKFRLYYIPSGRKNDRHFSGNEVASKITTIILFHSKILQEAIMFFLKSAAAADLEKQISPGNVIWVNATLKCDFKHTVSVA